MARYQLPPVDGLEDELKLVPASLRDDAVQEAWVAYLEHQSPANAISAFRRKEAAAQRHGFIKSDSTGDYAVDVDGSVIPLTTETRRPSESRRKHNPRVAARSERAA